jgi:hypothetical protein
MGDEVEREDGGCTGKRGRVESKGGRVTDQHNRHCQPTQLFPVLRLYPSPGPGPDHSCSPPPSHFSFSLLLLFPPTPRPLSSPTLSGQLHSPRHRLLLPHPVLCSFATSSALHRNASQTRLRTQLRTTGSCAVSKPGVLSHFTLQGTPLVPS